MISDHRVRRLLVIIDLFRHAEGVDTLLTPDFIQRYLVARGWTMDTRRRGDDRWMSTEAVSDDLALLTNLGYINRIQYGAYAIHRSNVDYLRHFEQAIRPYRERPLIFCIDDGTSVNLGFRPEDVVP